MSFFSHQWCSVFLLSVILGLCGCDAASVQKDTNAKLTKNRNARHDYGGHACT